MCTTSEQSAAPEYMKTAHEMLGKVTQQKGLDEIRTHDLLFTRQAL